MKTEHIDKTLERRILIGAVVSDRFLKDVGSIYRPEYMGSRAADTLLRWCMEYHEQYGKAPGRHIQDLFNSRVRKQELPEASEEFIGDLLASLSDEYSKADKLNAQYLLNQTEELFRSKGLEILAEDIRENLSRGDVTGAEALFSKYRPVRSPQSSGLNPFTDRAAIKEAFESGLDPVFRLPGALGEMMNDQLVRGSLIGILAPEKRYKTHLTYTMASYAYRNRCNVAVFECGDLTRPQRVLRSMAYVAKRPVFGPNERDALYPVLDCVKNRDGSCTKDECDGEGKLEEYTEDSEDLVDYVARMNGAGYKPCSACNNSLRRNRDFKGTPWYEIKVVKKLTEWRTAYKGARQWYDSVRGRDFKLSVHPNSTINTKGITSILDAWEHFDGFVPDVVVIDYADIMSKEDSRIEFRHNENERWKALRGLSQERHCCVIVPTQADAASYGRNSLSLGNFSEDKRKYGHVTAMYGLNQTAEEKQRQVLRVMELLIREADFSIVQQVKVLQCLNMGRAYIDSYW